MNAIRSASFLLLSVAVIATTTAWAADPAAKKAGDQPRKTMRDIVRDDLPDDVDAVALEYTVVLVNDGKEEPVMDPARHPFVVGDKFLIRIKAKDNLYAYVFHIGPGGKEECLLPKTKEKHLYLKKGDVHDVKGFRFTPPPGEEKLIVVATTEKSEDLIALAGAAFRKPNQELTAAQQAEENNSRQRTNVKMTTISASQKKGAAERGLLGDESIQRFNNNVKAKKRGMYEEPAHDEQTSTFAMAVSQKDLGKPELLVNISLKSTKPGDGNKP